MSDTITNGIVPLIGDRAIVQNTTWQMDFYWVTLAGAAIDLTGYTAAMKIRTDYEADVLLSLTSPSGGLVITGASGLVTATLTPAQTLALPAGPVVYDLLVTQTSTGIVKPLVRPSPGVVERVSTR